MIRLVSILTTFVITVSTTPTPRDVATVVGSSLVQHSHNFLNWEGGFTYGGAVTADGLAAASTIVLSKVSSSWLTTLDEWLDKYAAHDGTTSVPCNQHQPYGASNVTRSCAFNLANNISLNVSEWEWSTVGDSVGSFPLAYLERYLHRNGTVQDVSIARNTVETYVYPYHHHLNDGTVSRTGGCCAPPSKAPANDAPFLWADDQFMGLALMARLSAVPGVAKKETQREWIDHVATMQLNYAKYLLDDEDGLSAHGAYVDPTNPDIVLHSCCKWGRANGWGAMSRMEILKAMDTSFPSHPLRSSLLLDFKQFMDAMIAYQTDDGRWRQVVNETSTYLETSVTAMMVTALATGIERGWLEREKYLSRVMLAWDSLVRNTVNMTSGVVDGVCMGTGIQTNLTGYSKRGTDYFQSAPGGVGSVLLAAAAMDALLKNLLQ